jgi:hypothetical protein
MPEYGHGDPKPLCEIPMEPAAVPRGGDVLLLPGEGLRQWLVRKVERDLAQQPQEVAVWVSAA